MKKHKSKEFGNTLPGILIFGLVFSFAMLFLVSLILSALIMSTTNPSGSIKTVSLSAILISGVLSGFVISKKKGDGGIKASIVSSLIFVGAMLMISLVTTKGHAGGGVFMNCLCYMLISSFAAFIGRKKERRRRR